MKKLIVLLVLCWVANVGWAQEEAQQRAEEQLESAANGHPQAPQPEQEQGIPHIAASDAKLHVGETLAVCGTIASGVYNRKSQQKNTYLNFDKPYPDNTFTAVIKRKNRKYFDYKPEKLSGQWICVYGLIVMYRAAPEINVVIPKQIIAKEYPD